jgi:hypothetical protein
MTTDERIRPSYAILAAEAGTDKMTARKRAQRAGTADVRSIGRDGRIYSGSHCRNSERDQKIRDLRAAGLLLSEIADQVGVCRSTVERALGAQYERRRCAPVTRRAVIGSGARSPKIGPSATTTAVTRSITRRTICIRGRSPLII